MYTSTFEKQRASPLRNLDSFIFKIGNLHPDDLSRIEDMYRKFLKDNGAI